MKYNLAFWEGFWEWLLKDGERMKLPMIGAPTLRKHLEKKIRQYENEGI